MGDLSQFTFDSADMARGLTNDEIRSILPELSEQQKTGLVGCLEELNGELHLQICRKRETVRAERKISQILLQRVWSNINADNRRECAPFFRHLSEEINKNC